MTKKSDLYLKKFFITFVFIEFAIIGGLLLSYFAFSTNNFSSNFCDFCFFSFLNLLLTLLIYIRDPSPNKIIPKEKFGKITLRYAYGIVIFLLLFIFAYFAPITSNNNTIPPLFNNYGSILLIILIFWIIFRHKEIIQIFDVIVIYIKDALYPDTWPALEREERRKDDKELLYKRWLYDHGSLEEQNYYQNLSSKSGNEARNYAITRMRQIEKEKDSLNK